MRMRIAHVKIFVALILVLLGVGLLRHNKRSVSCSWTGGINAKISYMIVNVACRVTLDDDLPAPMRLSCSSIVVQQGATGHTLLADHALNIVGVVYHTLPQPQIEHCLVL